MKIFLFIALTVTLLYMIAKGTDLFPSPNRLLNLGMSTWQKIRYGFAVFVLSLGLLFFIFGIWFLIYIFHTGGEAAEAIVFAPSIFIIGFAFLSVSAGLALSIRHSISKKAFLWLTLPAVVTLIMWSSAVMTNAITTIINGINAK